MSDYPEHEKLKAVKDRSQAVGEFLEWLSSQGVQPCQWKDFWSNGKPAFLYYGEPGGSCLGTPNPEYESSEPGWYPVSKSIMDWLAEYFQIDQGRIEAEKEAMLDRMRELNAEEEPESEDERWERLEKNPHLMTDYDAREHGLWSEGEAEGEHDF